MIDKPNLAHLLDGVERFNLTLAGDMEDDPEGAWLYRDDVLADLPAALPDLTDPVTVHANMLRGTIAKPTVDQIIHLYGKDAFVKALSAAIDGVDERAGGLVYKLHIAAPWDDRMGEAADLITALIALATAQAAQIAGLAKEVEETNGKWGHTSNMLGRALSRAEAAEADLAAMTKDRDSLKAEVQRWAEKLEGTDRLWAEAETALAAERAKTAKLVEAGKFLAWMQKSGHPVAEAKEAWAKLSAALSEAEARDE